MAVTRGAISRGEGPRLHWTVSVHIDNDRIRLLAPRLWDQLSGRSEHLDIIKGNPEARQWIPRRLHADARRKTRNQERLSNQYRSNLATMLRDSGVAEAEIEARTSGPLPSIALRDAMEPMFEDVADRERLGTVDDYLLAIPATAEDLSPTSARKLSLTLKQSIGWNTEGRECVVDLGRALNFPETGGDKQALELRRFWYVHRNQSLSYHLGFTLTGYRHAPEYFYLFSLLQKQVAPKEFRLDGSELPPRPVGHDTLPIGPFEALRIGDAGSGEQTDFWRFVADLFDGDFLDLYRGLADGEFRIDPTTDLPFDRHLGMAGSPRELMPWNVIVKQEPYIPVPGLLLPPTRQMFYFADPVFRDLLLPRYVDGAPARRLDLLNEDFFDGELKAHLDRLDADESSPSRTIIGGDTWTWFEKNGGKAIDRNWFEEDAANGRKAGRRLDTAGDVNLALSYLFLAGFSQNIIDFLNQDASEVLDSLDPIYPSAEEDQSEGFYVRYANPQALTTFVARVRSLSIGDRYIGTCPYAFMVHLVALHNEFLARDYERFAMRMLLEIEEALHQARTAPHRQRELRHAAKLFYDFRRDRVTEYLRHRYENVFRYDTERSIFEELERIRGIEVKYTATNHLVEVTSERTRDQEERELGRRERRLGRFVAVITFLTLTGVFVTLSGLNLDGLFGEPDQTPDVLFYIGAASSILLIVAVIAMAVRHGRSLAPALLDMWDREKDDEP